MIRHGIAEIVKMAVVENYPLFELLEKVGPEFLVKTKFGTDLSILEGRPDIDLAEFDANCERIVGLAMESYVRAEYGVSLKSPGINSGAKLFTRANIEYNSMSPPALLFRIFGKHTSAAPMHTGTPGVLGTNFLQA